MATKVKITKDNEILAIVPYKNGVVTWKLHRLSPTRLTWSIYRKRPNHNPERVTIMHREFLNGKLVRSKIRKAAAASHSYALLNILPSISIERI